MSSLSSDEVESVRKIIDMVMPFDLDVRLRDVTSYLTKGFDRQKYIERMVQGAINEPLMQVKLKLIYAELDRLYRIDVIELEPIVNVP